MGRIKVLIADDEPQVRAALAEVIESDESLVLVGVARDAEEAVMLASADAPDVALLDVLMPGGGGTRATREIKSVAPLVSVIALSAHEDRSRVLSMLEAGAVSYLVKGTPIDEILEAIHRAALGQGTLGAEVTGEVVRELAGHLEREAHETEERNRSVGRLRGLLAEGGPTMVFQPIVNLVTGATVGHEALARFPDGGPEEWLREAARTGLRDALELAAVQNALEQLSRLPEQTYLSVNLSPETVTGGGFADTIDPPSFDRVVLEVTEHAPVDDYEAIERALLGFRAGGGRLAIDDAGAGFASLRHILRLAPDIIKIDMSLTRNIHRDGARRALAAALISFASQIKAEIVAEGIETAEELDALTQLGVIYGQGYHLARPAPLPIGWASSTPDRAHNARK